MSYMSCERCMSAAPERRGHYKCTNDWSRYNDQEVHPHDCCDEFVPCDDYCMGLKEERKKAVRWYDED